MTLPDYVCSNEDILRHASKLLKAELPVSLRLMGINTTFIIFLSVATDILNVVVPCFLFMIYAMTISNVLEIISFRKNFRH